MSDGNVPVTSPKTPLLTGAIYDRLKFVVQYVLPGAATLYAALAVLWGFPHGTEVVGTIGAITIFLSGLLGISTASYNKSDAKYDGALVMNYPADSENHSYSLEVDLPAAEVIQKKELTLKVLPTTDDWSH